MATSGGIEFNDDDIDPELDPDSQGDMEGSFEELPPEASDFDINEFEAEIEEPEQGLSEAQLNEIEQSVLEKVLATITKITEDEDVILENVVENENADLIKDVPDLLTSDKTIEKTVNKEITKLTKEAKAELAATKKELAKQQRREIQDEKRAVRREKRELTTGATRRRTDIHSDATAAKIATYSLAASAGLPGYVIASVVNRLLIEPAVEKDIEAERAYSDQLVNYYNEQEDALIEKQREYEDERDSLTTPEFNLEEVKDFVTSKGERPSTAPVSKIKQPTPKNNTDWPKGFNDWTDTIIQNNQPVQQPDPVKVVEDLSKLIDPPTTTKPTPQTSSVPEQPTANPITFVPSTNNPTTPTEFQPTSTSSPSGIDQGSPPSTGGTIPPIQPPVQLGQGGPSGEDGKPTIPNREFDPSSLITAAPIITAAIEGAQLVKDQVTKAGAVTQGSVRDLFNESPINYFAEQTQRVSDLVDPIGTNIPQEMFNQAVQTFATTVDVFGKFVDKDVAFSPETLGTTVEGDIDKLLKNMEIAERTDPQKAALKESMNRLDLIWAEFKADFFVAFAPFVARTLEVIAAVLEAIKTIINNIYTLLVVIDLALRLYMPLYGTLMNRLVKNTTNNTNNTVNSLEKELEQFHNPSVFPIAPKNVNKRFK